MDLEEEEILCPTCLENTANKLFAESEVEKLRLAGVDIILRMRRDLFALRRQFDEILEDLARQWKERL